MMIWISFLRHFPEESGETQSRPPGAKNLKIVNCRKNILLKKIQFNGN
jgi:hypothetical protein